ncbi:FHA domain-containing protein [Arthrobacter castelli]|uniref:FHA domain-containing protein n=1 Tax=Arthrobacter castelli TaxID=271431 RepID=UPI00041241E5|nr:FHA domain-containing protein [Arthrobacter castelli]
MRITYAPGEWSVIVRSGTLVVLPPDAGQTTISGIWDALAGAHNLETAWRAVTTAFDGDVTGMPPFAIASLQGRLHVMVRGQITIRSRNVHGETEVSGSHVTTWNEQVLADQDSLDIGFDEVTPGEPQLPLEAGVVRAAGLAISLADSGQRADGTGRVGKAEPAEVSDAGAGQPAQPQPAEPQPTVVPDNGIDQPSWRAGSDQTMSPTDLDAFEEDDEGHDNGAEPETGELTAVNEPVPADEAPEPSEPGAPTADEPAGSAQRSSGTAESQQPGIDSPAGTAPGLIESVPWMKRGPVSPPTASGTAEPEHASEAQVFDDEIDHDGQTVMRSELDTPPAPAASTDNADGSGGSDGAEAQGPSTAPIVLARICPSGHANPPTNASCSSCGSPIDSDPRQTRRPSLGSMRMSNGDVVELDRSVIVGRQPSMSRVQGNVMPRMVQVRSEESDISRSHVEVQLEGWHVMLRDLNSTNGTFLIREGQPPRRLAQGEQAMLLNGDIAELGDDVRLRFEGLK